MYSGFHLYILGELKMVFGSNEKYSHKLLLGFVILVGLHQRSNATVEKNLVGYLIVTGDQNMQFYHS